MNILLIALPLLLLISWLLTKLERDQIIEIKDCQRSDNGEIILIDEQGKVIDYKKLYFDGEIWVIEN